MWLFDSIDFYFVHSAITVFSRYKQGSLPLAENKNFADDSILKKPVIQQKEGSILKIVSILYGCQT